MYRRNGIEPYESDRVVLERRLTGATEDVERGRQILLHPHRRALYDRYHADLSRLGQLRQSLRLENGPFCREDELGDFHVRPQVHHEDFFARGPFREQQAEGDSGDQRFSRVRRWSARAAILAALALVISSEMGVDVPWLTEGSGPTQAQSDMAAFEANGNRRFAVADMINIHDRPDSDSPIIGQLDRHDIVHIDEGRGTWVRLLNRGQNGYVDRRFLASRADCEEQGITRPKNEAVLGAGVKGNNRLRVRNDSSRDAVVKVSNPLGAEVVTLFVRARSTADYDKLPGGAYRFRYATGEDFSPYCGVFLRDMVASMADAPLRLPDGGKGQLVTYTIQGAAHGNFAGGRILLDAF
ncbi:SH3 domain-containing protein [Ectothiorhodospiraceae bacterium WFHF3C12]|nr:SH3 domain-containing protein [Ectothiorhodospiraceae bacterium WFHF3C12]